MKFETKFNVKDIIKCAIDVGRDDMFVAYEVLGINTETCYAGTQVFYTCRAIVGEKKYKSYMKEENDFKWVVGHGVAKKDGEWGVSRFREDEMVECPKEILDILRP